METPAARPLPLVLVIEDDPELEGAVRAGLSPAFAVASVGASTEGVGQGAALGPDLVVMGPGHALLARREPGLREVPLLLVTDRGDVEARADLLRDAAQDFVLRPVSPAEIRRRAGNLITARRARDLLRRAAGASEEGSDLESLARACLLRHGDLVRELAAARRGRDRADRLSRAKTAYLRTVGHEIAAPLASIREALGLVRASTASLPAAAGHGPGLCAIETATDWLAELGQALRELAKAEHGDDAARTGGGRLRPRG